MDKNYGSKATLELELSENTDVLSKHIDFKQFQTLNCIARYTHDTQTDKDLAIWI